MMPTLKIGYDYGDGFIQLSDSDFCFWQGWNHEVGISEELFEALKTHRCIQSAQGFIVLNREDTDSILSQMDTESFWRKLEENEKTGYAVSLVDLKYGHIIVGKTAGDWASTITTIKDRMMAVKYYLLKKQ